jgi:predicted dithiol-disulfide oxidoreductase (DUF899 family)
MTMTDQEARVRELREQISQLQRELMEMRRATPVTVPNYAFETIQGTVTMKELFGSHRDLILIHNMGKDCRYCTLWADGLNGHAPELQSRAAFVLLSADTPEVAAGFATGRGWRFPVVSEASRQISKDTGFISPEGDPWPGCSTYRLQDDGTILRVAATEFGPGDGYCAVWPLFDLLLDGPGDWEPNYRL